jgi:Chaperone of endosialidase
MGWFDFLSGSDEAEQAAAANRAAAQQGYGLTQQAGQKYQTGALSELGTGLTQATGALGTGLGSQVDAYNKAIADATAAGKAGVEAYSPLSNLGANYGRAVNRYYDALGLNGPGGGAAAREAFVTSPGYQFQVDEATRAAANKAASLGIAGSGNTLDAIRGRAQGIASGEWGNYLDRLGSFVNPQLAATSGAAAGTAGAYKNLADIATTGGGMLGSAYGTNAAQLAGLYSGGGESRANVLGNVAGIETQGARDLTTGNISANNLVAQAAMQDAANYWGGIGNVAKAVGNAVGSDRRIKNSVEQIGTLFDGTPVYRFRYNGHPAVHVGLMAQDVERDRPEAVIEIGGVKHVDYDLATRGIGR